MHKPTKTELLAGEIVHLMSNNQHWTVTAVATVLKVTEERVRVAMRKLLNSYVIYHSQRIEPSHANAYRLISAAQAMSADLTVEHVCVHDAKREAKIDQRYRRQDASWPRGDDLLVSAMHAMVSCRQSATTDN
ncbi:hypothetical protein WS61_03295 [Burkholderia sp. ABCPW 11]|uniref:hypothetical protein n=1 Tax=Burkholderia sp. ABCPW 11 TaxID=1637859 RepID=UPI0007558071|nr:hypothetical protein [Burkholderia sp. ABCPW 11]KVD50092.1 hypothetical protein WS61_03295 [Burkholderia sp. ABCPW 11]